MTIMFQKMSRYEGIVKDMVTIDMAQGESQLFARNAKLAEGLLAGDLATSSASCYSSAWVRFQEYCEEVGK